MVFRDGVVELQENKLLRLVFDVVGKEFWTSNSQLVNQITFTVISCILAETTSNADLSRIFIPMLLEIVRKPDGCYQLSVAQADYNHGYSKLTLTLA